MTRERVFLAGLWILIVGTGVFPGPASAAETATRSEGEALAARLRSAKPEENLEVQGMLVIRNAAGRRTRVPFRNRVVIEPGGWKVIYETLAPDGSLGERLEVIRSDQASNQYLCTVAGDASPKTVAGDAAMIPFAGSDFWLADLGLEFLHWPRHRIVEEAKIKMRKGRPCKVLESVNPDPGARGYTRVRSWIDTKTDGVILAEAFGPDQKLMKEFEIGGLVKVDGKWELKNMEMRTRSTDTQTVLEFKYEAREAPEAGVNR